MHFHLMIPKYDPLDGFQLLCWMHWVQKENKLLGACHCTNVYSSPQPTLLFLFLIFIIPYFNLLYSSRTTQHFSFSKRKQHLVLALQYIWQSRLTFYSEKIASLLCYNGEFHFHAACRFRPIYLDQWPEAMTMKLWPYLP